MRPQGSAGSPAAMRPGSTPTLITGVILKHSTLNVHILTRGPLARRDFDIMKAFGKRLLFGISIPTLDPQITRIYEPGAPDPRRRLETLAAAHEPGIPTFVAIAPVFPECDRPDLVKTMAAVKAASPMTVFTEPVNIRRGIDKRIAASAAAQETEVDVSVFKS